MVDDLLDLIGQLVGRRVGGEEGGKPAESGGPALIAEHAAGLELLDEAGNGRAFAATATVGEFGLDDVEATLHQTPGIREAELDLLALGSTQTDLGHREVAQAGGVFVGKDALEAISGHGCDRTDPYAGPMAQPSSPTSVDALIFDFDGLIADTERVEFEAWRATWEEYGHVLALDEWVQCIGTVGGWDPLDELGRRVGAGFDADLATTRRRARHWPAIAALLAPLPGVVDLLDDADAAGIPTAIASSSDLDWVGPLVAQVGLADRFAHIAVFDGTCPAKPAPDLYLRACAGLGVDPASAVAFEDSPNGVAAAKAAGLRCVAVPHDLTRALDLSAADAVIDSLAGIRLDDLPALVSGPRSTRTPR